MRKRHTLIGIGGTFDHFHAGHEKLLLFADELAEKVLIGVTEERMTRYKLFDTTIQPYNDRTKNVMRFCQQHKIAHAIVKLSDPMGPTLENSDVQALAVSPETEPGAEKINELRQNLGLRELPVYICDFFKAENQQPLHADQIRSGKLNRQGIVYDLLLQSDITLNDQQRNFFKSPQGEILFEPNYEDRIPAIAVVGDYCLDNFQTHHWPFQLGVYDLKQQREFVASQFLDHLKPQTTVCNPAGGITSQLTQALQSAVTASPSHPYFIKVEGEEDLAAVALVLLMPLNSEIYYGQPNQGMVRMIATEELKNTVYQVLKNPNLSQT